ncbi:hypothetical protein DSO57_1005614 [Entomophthora muscae]|uniref:Uncharacterized protein n=1 Tax=Entomophthora muscae TaxID=34485 RepID=A0ACC2RMX6_9FUNG|nr:hypothetical protein DSO57_1005614 [Entomophthora muscae]
MKAIFIFSLASVLALGPCPNPSQEICYRGGSILLPCTGMSCAPCWVPQNNATWSCFEKTITSATTTACPGWSDVVDITNPPSNCANSPARPTTQPSPGVSVCPTVSRDTCYKDGQMQSPCRGFACPPCWQLKNQKWACIDAVNGNCASSAAIDIRKPLTTCIQTQQRGI